MSRDAHVEQRAAASVRALASVTDAEIRAAAAVVLDAAQAGPERSATAPATPR